MSQSFCDGVGCEPAVTRYSYDSANRLTMVESQAYTWDNAGNLLSDGTNTYVYDAANRLTSVASVAGGGHTTSYTYNGLGDRLSQTVDGVTTTYTLDTQAGLTQVLSESAPQGYGSSTYLYGLGRIGEQQSGGFVYHLADTLGSVRQLVNGSGQVTLAQSYEPYGKLFETRGSESIFGFARERWTVALSCHGIGPGGWPRTMVGLRLISKPAWCAWK